MIDRTYADQDLIGMAPTMRGRDHDYVSFAEALQKTEFIWGQKPPKAIIGIGTMGQKTGYLMDVGCLGIHEGAENEPEQESNEYRDRLRRAYELMVEAHVCGESMLLQLSKFRTDQRRIEELVIPHKSEKGDRAGHASKDEDKPKNMKQAKERITRLEEQLREETYSRRTVERTLEEVCDGVARIVER